ncbi:MAG: hypothetical protein WCG28_03390 [bacterium]
MPTIKNIIIFIAIGAVFAGAYWYFTKGSSTDTASLISVSGNAVSTNTNTSAQIDNSAVAQEFLTSLLNVKNIKLDDAIFSDKAFISLHDSSIILTPDGNEGRANPFAPLGNDVVAPTCVSPQILNTLTNTCVDAH